MVLLNYAAKEVNAKVVYYGPPLAGKSSNLQYIHDRMPAERRGKMVSLATEKDRTLFFDLLPVEIDEIEGYKTRIQLYTVPGQVYYNSTRKLVLTGVDAIVFVADSQKNRQQENIESFQNLHDNLSEHGLSLEQIPWVIQYNKRDVKDVSTVKELDIALNSRRVPSFQVCALTGDGVLECLNAISRLVIDYLRQSPGFKGSIQQKMAISGRSSLFFDFKKQKKNARSGQNATNAKLSRYNQSELPNEIAGVAGNHSAPNEAAGNTPRNPFEDIHLYKATPYPDTLQLEIQTENVELPDLNDITIPTTTTTVLPRIDLNLPLTDYLPSIQAEPLVETVEPPLKKIGPPKTEPKGIEIILPIAEAPPDEHLPEFLKTFDDTVTKSKKEFDQKEQAVSELLVGLEKFDLNSDSMAYVFSILQAMSQMLRAQPDQQGGLMDLMRDYLDLQSKSRLDGADQAVCEAIVRLEKYDLNWHDLLLIANKLLVATIDRKVTERLAQFRVRFDPTSGQIFYVRVEDEHDDDPK